MARMNTIAVLTPSWNRGSFLRELYESLLSQDFKDFEWLIVDDCSNDDTEYIVKKFQQQAPFRITYIRYVRRVGKIRADNTCWI